MDPGPPPRHDTRLLELDGLRGWASLAVVIYHFGWELFGVLHPGVRNLATGLFNGELAVCLFFVLSGEALSVGAFGPAPLRAIRNVALKRYLRLSLPIAVATLVVLALMRLGWVWNVPAGARIGRPEWLGEWLRFDPTLRWAFGYSAAAVYADPPRPLAWSPFLWTMRVELLGSGLVFATLLAARGLKRPPALLAVPAALALLAFPPTRHFGGFLVGVCLAQWRAGGGLAAVRDARWTAACSGAAGAALWALSSRLALAGREDLQMLVAAPLAAAVFLNRPACAFLRRPLSLQLGRLSFPLYLMQFPVLVSLTSGLVCRAARLDGATCLGVATVSVVACLAAAAVFSPVEDLTRRVNRRLVRAVDALGASRRRLRPRSA